MARLDIVLLLAAFNNAVVARSIPIDGTTNLRNPTEPDNHLQDLDAPYASPISAAPASKSAVALKVASVKTDGSRPGTSPTGQSRSTRKIRRSAQRKKYNVSGSDKPGDNQRNQNSPPEGLQGKYSRLGTDDAPFDKPAAVDKPQPAAAKQGVNWGAWKDPVGLLKETLGALKELAGLWRETKKFPKEASKPLEEASAPTSDPAAGTPRVEPARVEGSAKSKRQLDELSGLDETLKNSLRYLHSVLKSTMGIVGDPAAALGDLFN